MRLLHTSDWHLGRLFHGVSLRGAHEAYLDHLVDVVRSEAVDAVLVSGDVYDKAIPSPDTVSLLSTSVVRLIDAGAVVVLSSGNHDSAIRLGFASPLLARAGLHIRTDVGSVGQAVTVKGVDIYPLPYLEPSVVSTQLATGERTHAGVLRAAMARVAASRQESPRPTVVMAHAFVNGGIGSESERDISVGGVSGVNPQVFEGASYVALGHLHGRQQVAEHQHYSGSPVAMSFSEARHVKSTVLVDVTPGCAAVSTVEAPVARPLSLVRGTLEHVLTHEAYTAAQAAYCQVTLTDPVRPAGAFDAVRRRFPHAVELRFEPQGVPASSPLSYAARVAARTELEVCCDFVDHVRGAPATTAESAELRLALDASRVASALAQDDGAAPSMARTVA